MTLVDGMLSLHFYSTYQETLYQQDLEVFLLRFKANLHYPVLVMIIKLLCSDLVF